MLSRDWKPGCWGAMVSDFKGGVFIITRGNLRHAHRGDWDGALWSSDWCPEAMCVGPFLPRLFHGTAADHTEGICTGGLLPSEQGRLGPGVYFTDCLTLADKAADRHGPLGRGVGKLVVVAKVDFRTLIDKGEDNDKSGSWRSEFHAATGMHPPWLGSDSFREFCVGSNVSYRIMAIHSVGGHLVLAGNKRIRIGGAVRFDPPPVHITG